MRFSSFSERPTPIAFLSGQAQLSLDDIMLLRSRVRVAKWLVCLLAVTAISATSTAFGGMTYYWDFNGATAGFGTITGGWDGANAFWNTDSAGGAGTLVAAPTSADDLNITVAPRKSWPLSAT